MIRAAVAALLLAAPSVPAAVLYDGSLGTTPQQQGLTYLAIGPNTNTTSGGATTLDTTANLTTYAGFGTTAATLDRTVGYTLRVDARVVSEAHPGNVDRAGFSLLVVSSDLKAIELGLHTNEIFSQNSVTTAASRGETVATDTTSALREYDLSVLGNTYTLRANGTPILTGALRDYSAFAGPINPYTTPNSIFLGDDTTSASGATTFSYASVAVPEPGTLGALAGMLLAAARRCAKRERARG